MKKNALLFFLALSITSLFAQGQTTLTQDKTALVQDQTLSTQSAQVSHNSSEDFVRQILLPQEVFVGDKAQLLYIFTSPVDFFSEEKTVPKPQSEKEESISLSKEIIPSREQFTITSVELKRLGITYTLSVSFIPWKSGEIDFAPFNLYEALQAKTNNAKSKNTPVYIVDINPLTVSSIAEKKGSTSLRPPVAPLLLPGTTFLLWGFFAVLTIFIFALSFILIKFSLLKEIWHKGLEKKELIKNAKLTKLKLKKLKNQNCPDSVFAKNLQSILRDYLQFKFGFSFASVTTQRMNGVIQEATGNVQDKEKEEAVFSIISLFSRTEYILFAENSIDSKQFPKAEHEAAFLSGEKEGTITTALNAIDILEGKSNREGAQ